MSYLQSIKNSKLGMVVSATFLAGFLITSVGNASETIVPDSARNMTAVELYELYKDKSWLWDDGAGRFASFRRGFSAWSISDGTKSWAKGRWVITNDGLMCLKAEWFTENGGYPDKSCFSHKVDGAKIYQKREPDGAWIIFQDSTTKEDQLESKLVSEDMVSKSLTDIKKEITSSLLSKQ